ncbi:hypothetical protein Tco_1425438 [Tanacetum coccineum]
MATTRNPDTLHEDKGKMVIAEPEITDIADLSPTHSDKSIEVIGPPIQANTDVQDAEYFNQLLRINRISGLYYIGIIGYASVHPHLGRTGLTLILLRRLDGLLYSSQEMVVLKLQVIVFESWNKAYFAKEV